MNRPCLPVYIILMVESSQSPSPHKVLGFFFMTTEKGLPAMMNRGAVTPIVIYAIRNDLTLMILAIIACSSSSIRFLRAEFRWQSSETLT